MEKVYDQLNSMEKGFAAQVKRPNFFILGAAKSGTTFLDNALRLHPQVFMSPVKEPTFFCRSFQVVANPIEYFELFAAAGRENIIGEASHAYLTDPSSAGVLHALFPDARFLVVLRNPADRAHSLYQHMRRCGHEWLNTFEKALAAEEGRYNSAKFMNTCGQYFQNFLYFRSGLYAEQLRRYFSLFDPSRFKVISFERLVADSGKTFREIFAFLGVDADFKPGPVSGNPGCVTARLPLVQYLWNNRVKKPFWLRRAGLALLQRVNMVPIPPLRPRTRAILLERYEKSLDELSDLVGIVFPRSGKQ
jgi:hypothetical protein